MIQHTFHQISPHVYWLSPDSTTDRPTLGAIVGERRVLLVDAGNSPAHAHVLLNELSKVTAVPPAFVVLTHWHWDHVFGTSVLDLPTLAHVETRRIVTEMSTWDWSDAALDQRVAAGIEIAFCRDMLKAELPDRTGLTLRPPDLGFTDRVELDLGGLMCRIEHIGGDHAADSVVVHVPDDQIVFLGDCLYADIYHPQRRYTTRKLFPLLDRLLSYNAECYLAGHHTEPITRAQMIEEDALLKTIGSVVEQHAPDRDAILATVQEALAEPLTEDHLDLIEEFLAGLPDRGE